MTDLVVIAVVCGACSGWAIGWTMRDRMVPAREREATDARDFWYERFMRLKAYIERSHPLKHEMGIYLEAPSDAQAVQPLIDRINQEARHAKPL